MDIPWRERLAQLKEEWKRARAEHPNIAFGVAGAFILSAVLAVGGSLWFVIGLTRGLPDDAAISRIGVMDQSTAVFDANDQLAFTIFKEQRVDVPLEEISPNFTKALLAIEDQHFYEHHGFDLTRIGSAALANLRHRRAVQGGSTITQQLARQSFLTPDKTLRRKVQELILAERIEHSYSKPRILELYLNKVYFGDGLYGAEAAARGYFGKHASELSLPEAALLAGLVKSPSSYAPTVSMERAVARRNVVLQAMLDEKVIDRAAWQSARATKVALKDTLRSGEPHGQYFKEALRLELVDRFGWQSVYQGGLRVYSTLDMNKQIAAETAIADQLAAVEKRRTAWLARKTPAKTKKKDPAATEVVASEPLQAALVSMDPVSGHVRAMVGGRDFDASHFNRAVQARRQPGSAFKPFVYATALEAGYSPASVIDNLNAPIATLKGAWTPEDEHSGASSLTMRAALRTSSNRAAVQMLQQVGISRTVQYAKQMGVGDVPSVPSLALGSGEVTLQSMTAAYAAFVNKGLVPKPLLIRRVEDRDGRLLYQAQEYSTPAISETTAFLMSSMLADVVNAGTGARARSLGFTLPAAGKTGTTNDYNDAWFIGYTPKLVTGVWFGFDQPHTILPGGFAAEVAVPAWANYMKVATKGDAPAWLTPPASVTTATVCRISGKLATEGCRDVETVNKDGVLEHRSMIYTEYFARGTEPTSSCDMHQSLGLLSRIAGFFGGDRQAPTRPPEPAPSTTAPPVPVATAGAIEKIENPPPPPERKKRGFWSRLFGRGEDESKPDSTTAPPKKKGGQ